MSLTVEKVLQLANDAVSLIDVNTNGTSSTIYQKDVTK